MCPCGIGMIPFIDYTCVQTDNITLLQNTLFVWNTMHNLIIYRYANRGRISIIIKERWNAVIAADYFLSGCKWNGPRAGFNPAGWISWFFGFFVGAYPFFQGLCPALPQVAMPCPPLLAFVVGFVLYFVLASVGLQSKTLEMEAVVED